MLAWRICPTWWPGIFNLLISKNCLLTLSHPLPQSYLGPWTPSSCSISDHLISHFFLTRTSSLSSLLVYLPPLWRYFDLFTMNVSSTGLATFCQPIIPPPSFPHFPSYSVESLWLFWILNFSCFLHFWSIWLTISQPRWTQVSLFPWLHCPVEISSTKSSYSINQKKKKKAEF